MHDDGTLYYAHYTPQLHYRGIALDDDDKMMNECWPWPPSLSPSPSTGSPRSTQLFDYKLGQCAVHICTDNLTTVLYSVQCRCLSLARQPTKGVTQDPTPINTPSEDVLTPHKEYISGLVRCQVCG